MNELLFLLHRRALGGVAVTMSLISGLDGCRSATMESTDPVGEGTGGDPASLRQCVPADTVPGPPVLVECSARGSGSVPLIDDLENGDLSIATTDGRQGAWFVYTDETPGCIESSIEPADDGAALHVRGEGFSAWGAGFGLALHAQASGAQACLYDASAYAGLRFRARGNAPLRVGITTRTSTFQSLGGTCPDGEGCYDRHGRNLVLTDRWQTFDVDFCALAQEGWGTPLAPFDPKEIAQITFHARRTGQFDVWLDDLEFLPSGGARAATCGAACPLERLPAGLPYDPIRTPTEGGASGLSLFTFEQSTTDCGPLVRRYLAYVPKGLGAPTDAPILIVLPGTTADAESMVDFMTGRRFIELADRDGFVVVFSNAAPGAWTVPDRPNGGRFSLGPHDDAQVDDIAYLDLVRADLLARGLIGGANPLFLAGLSIGGGLALEAAIADPTRYRGIAAVMPYDGEVPSTPPRLEGSALTSVFVAYSHADPGLPRDYDVQLDAMVGAWSTALGVGGQAPTQTPLPDRIVEGADYRGEDPVALRTRDSHAIRVDYGSGKNGSALRVVVFDRAGHLWPMAGPYEDAALLAAYGHRNRDVDMSDEIWEFFRGRL